MSAMGQIGVSAGSEPQQAPDTPGGMLLCKQRTGEGEIMCARVTCDVCGKATWEGCGQHVELALRGVPAEQRCAGHGNVAA